jgi:hypothetical protein
MADGTHRHRQLTHRYFKSKANLWCGTRELGDEVGFRNFTLRFAFTSHTSFSSLTICPRTRSVKLHLVFAPTIQSSLQFWS